MAVAAWFKNKPRAIATYGHISIWDTSEVTSMKKLFENRASFNEDISRWQVQNVTDMSYMFDGAESFNGNLEGWQVQNVTNMVGMFWGAESFNRKLGGAWSTNKRADKAFMFDDCPGSIIE